MKNTIKVLGLIALAAVIGFSMAACKNGTTPPPTDPMLFGRWEVDDTMFVFNNNGTYELQNDDVKEKGTFTASGGVLTITTTNIWGSFWVPPLDEKWYTKPELLAAHPEQAVDINDYFTPLTGTYSVSGTTLTLTIEGGSVTLTKKP